MELAARLMTAPSVPLRLSAASERVLSPGEGPSCRWCGLATDPRWPAGHPAALVVADAGPRVGAERLAHRFCADPANRKFDVDAPVDPVVVRRARLAFALRGAGARGWWWFELGSDAERTTLAHLRSVLRLGARVTAADVLAALTGPLTRRLYRERVRRWARLPLPGASAGGLFAGR
ncbi:hypothetical protein [Saccharothrix yanglingensis]|uniref:Uncharacterized protein n=1 Tax=Saccharothrix yanglingensis TaxID=659496 RepID=A0ABU0X044_9PSEU|nr:hypothetical protein [Saccharothrix yanglingensis]MDQ2585108.1 hypothetical protein [Saccharothrix yanglingensis]